MDDQWTVYSISKVGRSVVAAASLRANHRAARFRFHSDMRLERDAGACTEPERKTSAASLFGAGVTRTRARSRDDERSKRRNETQARRKLDDGIDPARQRQRMLRLPVIEIRAARSQDGGMPASRSANVAAADHGLQKTGPSSKLKR